MKTSVQLDAFLSAAARDAGMQVATDHANAVDPGWSERAYQMFKDWLRGWPKGYCFQIETFRLSAHFRGLETPPTARAFGSIAVRAKKERLITNIGIKATRAVSAHRANAGYWQKL